MKYIQLDNILGDLGSIINQPFDFEINPLDINLAKIQFNFMNNFYFYTNSIENIEFSEIYNSKDPNLNISDIKVICKKIFNTEMFKLELIVNDAGKSTEFLFTIAEGSKDYILSVISDKRFLVTCKFVVQEIDKMRHL